MDGVQQGILSQVLTTIVLAWITMAIVTGLWASEIKKRRFWVWVLLSLLTGPVAWYLLFLRKGVAVPKELAVPCPRCGRETRSDLRLCVHCRKPIAAADKDRAGELGRQAATMVFTARRLFDQTRRRGRG